MIYFNSKDKKKIEEFVAFLDTRVPVYKKFIMKMFLPERNELIVTEDTWSEYRKTLLETNQLKVLIKHIEERFTLEEAKKFVDSYDETLRIREEV